MFTVCTRTLYTVINVNNLYWISFLDSHPLQWILIICTRYNYTVLNINNFFILAYSYDLFWIDLQCSCKLIRCTWYNYVHCSGFDVHVTVHRDKFLIIKPTRCTNFSNLFFDWNCTCFEKFLCPSSGVFHCTHNNGICRMCLLTACEQDQDGTKFHPEPARKLTANLYDIYHCCEYSEKFLMMDRGNVRNM